MVIRHNRVRTVNEGSGYGRASSGRTVSREVVEPCLEEYRGSPEDLPRFVGLELDFLANGTTIS